MAKKNELMNVNRNEIFISGYSLYQSLDFNSDISFFQPFHQNPYEFIIQPVAEFCFGDLSILHMGN